MAQKSRLLAAGALVLSLCAVLHSSDSLAKVPAAAQAAASSEEKFAHLVAKVVLYTVQAVSSLLPGLTFALAGWALFVKNERLSRPARLGLGALLLLLAAVFAGRQLAPGAGAAAPAEQAAESAGEGKVVAQPHSGEEVLMSDDSFVRLADPTVTDGSPLTESWRQNLASALVTAIAQGQEQVVIMFTRQGCPWCDRQLPVLQDAIRKRAALAASAGGAAAGVAFVGGGAGANSLLTAPLRVFILDADEFPHLIQQFGVEAFPTNLIFGRPRVTPLLGRGYLDEESFEQACREAALAEPEPEDGAPPPRKQKGRKGRRGLFR